jgi:hypothetical protein
MSDTEKIDFIKQKLSELSKYRTDLNNDNFDNFKTLKLEILNLLDDNQRTRFNQINFVVDKPDYSGSLSDDLPF